MAYGLGPKQIADKKSVNIEEFMPSSGWTEDSSCHYLLVDLPDFKREEVKLQVDNSGYLTISGERRVSEIKFRHFQQTIKVPENADIDKITGKFEGEMLHVVVPKKEIEEEEGIEEEGELEDENGTTREAEKETEDEESESEDEEDEKSESEDAEHHHSHIEEKEEGELVTKKEVFNEEAKEKGGAKSSMLLCVVKKIKRNKGYGEADNEATRKEKKKEKHEKKEKDGEKEEQEDNEKTKDKSKKKDKDKCKGERDKESGDKEKKKKNPEDKKDPVKLKAKMEKIDSKMKELSIKREEILKLVQEAENNAANPTK